METLNTLVEKLTKEQRIEFSRPKKDAEALQESIERKYVHILFTATGTELGVQLHLKDCSLEKADFEKREGRLRLAGGLMLNYNKVKCIANLDLSSCEGTGYLVPVDDQEYDLIMGR